MQGCYSEKVTTVMALSRYWPVRSQNRLSPYGDAEELDFYCYSNDLALIQCLTALPNGGGLESYLTRPTSRILT